MKHVLNGILSHTEAQVGNTALPRWGIVKSYDPSTHRAKVELQPDQILTNWCHIQVPVVGDGLGFWFAPVLDQIAFLTAQHGDSDHYVITGFDFLDSNKPPDVSQTIGGGPVPLAPGEFAFSGNGVEFRISQGKIYFKGEVEIEGTLTVSDNITGQKDINAQGDVADHHGKLDGLRQHYNSHDHAGVQSGGSNTAGPSPTD